jgi:hypothetical protein
MIYIDMDDVVADFSGYVNSQFGTKFQVGHGNVPVDIWNELSKYHSRMFRDLEPNLGFISDGYEWIRDRFQDSEIAFLSAVPVNGSWNWRFAAQDKVDWIREHFGTRHDIFLSPYTYDKHYFCRSAEDVLVDDRTNLCEDWIRKGGTAIIFRNNDQFVKEFKEL